MKLARPRIAISLYRAITEKHAFYSCETVGSDVTKQFIRDFKVRSPVCSTPVQFACALLLLLPLHAKQTALSLRHCVGLFCNIAISHLNIHRERLPPCSMCTPNWADCMCSTSNEHTGKYMITPDVCCMRKVSMCRAPWRQPMRTSPSIFCQRKRTMPPVLRHRMRHCTRWKKRWPNAYRRRLRAAFVWTVRSTRASHPVDTLHRAIHAPKSKQYILNFEFPLRPTQLRPNNDCHLFIFLQIIFSDSIRRCETCPLCRAKIACVNKIFLPTELRTTALTIFGGSSQLSSATTTSVLSSGIATPCK